MRILVRFLVNLLGLWLAVKLVSGFQINGHWQGYVVAALVLALLNLLVKPILRAITFPLIIATLGLFGLIINALILWLASQFAGAYISITGAWALLIATIIITVVNMISHWI